VKSRLWLFALLAAPAAISAQVNPRDETMYLSGGFNWSFLHRYPDAARLFNAFDYGHAVLYERLLKLPDAAATAALAKDYDYLVKDLLVHPPRFAIVEEAVAPDYAKLAWPAMQTFDWAHVLHRQVYDAFTDASLSAKARDALIERLTDHYLANRRYALAPVPKAMELMDGQPFSQRFRKVHTRFNGLIWSYHWLQVGLYQPMMTATTAEEQAAGVKRVLAHFREMLADPDHRFPEVMPMTAAVAPAFADAHPRAAAIFDNLHMLHDIISDVLAAPDKSRDWKRDQILRQLAEMHDTTKNVMTWEHWKMMGEMMGGVGRMGGVAR
jgi:hypothetical protein